MLVSLKLQRGACHLGSRSTLLLQRPKIGIMLSFWQGALQDGKQSSITTCFGKTQTSAIKGKVNYAKTSQYLKGYTALLAGVPLEWHLCCALIGLSASKSSPFHRSMKVSGVQVLRRVLLPTWPHLSWTHGAHFWPCSGSFVWMEISTFNLCHDFTNGLISVET